MKTGKKRLTGTLLALCAALLVLCIVLAIGWSKTAKTDAVLPEVRNNGTAVQWKYRDETDWRDLVALTELRGAAGENGKNGTDGKDGSNGTDGKNGINGTNGKDGMNGVNGADGQNGKDGKDGSNGTDGKNGINGTNGKDGMNGVDGTDGQNGIDGKDGVNGKDGMNAKNIEVQRAETHIQWRYEGGEWQNLVAIADIEGPAGQNGTDGANGKTPEFRVNENALQWRYVGDEIWLNLYDLTALKGADGRDGVDGKDGINGKDGTAGKDGTNGQNGRDGKDGKTPFIGENGNWWIGEIDTGVKAAGVDGTDGEKGEKGEKGDKGDPGDKGEKGDKGDKGDPGQNGGSFGYFAANGRVYSWGTPLPFNVKKESGDLISYDSSSKTITLSKGHTYSMVFSGTVMISANGNYKLCGASLIDGYNSSEMMLETRTYVSMIDDGQGARLGMSYNTIYRSEADIALTFQYTNMLFQNTNFTDSQYNITIIALD